MTTETLGSKLLALKERSGLTLTNIAKGAGYRQPSSIQRYFSHDYEAEHLPTTLGQRLQKALVGFGEPPIVPEDLIRLSAFGYMLDRDEGAFPPPSIDARTMQLDWIPVSTTFPIATYIGEAEAFTIMRDPAITFVKPAHLSYRRLEGFLVSTDAMAPRFVAGEVVIYDTERPVSIGSDVLLFIAPGLVGENSVPDNQQGFAVVANLVGRNRETLSFGMYNPACTFELARRDICSMHPILGLQEMLAEKTTHDA